MYSYFYFLIYGFLGWTMETTMFSIEEKRFVNRGFLNGPICPIYGVGMLLILGSLSSFKDNIILLFILGGLFATIVEYIVGYLLEKLFYTRWWDYSEKKFNIKGYICLENSIGWCILSVVMIKYVQPYISDFVRNIDYSILKIIGVVTLVIMIIDGILTLNTLINFRDRIKKLNNIREEISTKLELKLSDSSLARKFRNYEVDISDILTEVKNKLSDKKEDIEFIKTLESAKERYQARFTISRQQKRLLKNYKKSNFNKFIDVLKNKK